MQERERGTDPDGTGKTRVQEEGNKLCNQGRTALCMGVSICPSRANMLCPRPCSASRRLALWTRSVAILSSGFWLSSVSAGHQQESGLQEEREGKCLLLYLFLPQTMFGFTPLWEQQIVYPSRKTAAPYLLVIPLLQRLLVQAAFPAASGSRDSC